MPIYRRAGGSWNAIRNVYRRAGGSWVQINAVYRRAGGTWNRVFSRVSTPSIQSTVEISKSTNGTTFLVTLTGRNYFWSQSPTSLSYKFQWSSNGGSSWSDISTGTATNPSSGSSNTYTYSVPTSEVAANVNNLYRFSVTATNASGSGTSTSSNLSYAEIQGPTNISLTTTTLGGSSVGLSWTASTGAGAYLVYYSTDNSTYNLFSAVLAGTTSTTVTGLSGTGTLYYFKILPVTGTSNTYKGYSGNFSNTVSANLATYTVSFNGNGGSGSSAQTIPAGSSISLPSSSRTGYTFNGWYTASSGGTFVGISGTSYTPSSSITLYAQWSAITYTVTWDANGGSVSPTSNSGVYGATVTAPTPTRTGYTFQYWRSPLSGGDPIFLNAGASYTIIGSITFYAIWTINTFTVTYDEQGGSAVSDATVSYGSSTTLPSTSRAGYTFNGWYSASSGGTFLGNAGTSYGPVTSSVTIYAQWTAITYTVTWNANGGTVSPTSNSGASGTIVTVPTPTRSGFTLQYWRSPLSGGDPIFLTPGTSYTITGNITFYAIWAVPLPVISSIVARNGGTGGAYNMQWTITSTNTASYTIIVYYGASTPPTNTFSNTVSSSVIQTNLGNDLNDYYYLVITPWSGAGGTGSAGVQRTTTIKRNTSTATNTTNNY